MTIEKYIEKLSKSIRECRRKNRKIDAGTLLKLRFAIAYTEGDKAIDELRDKRIAKEITAKYSIDDQIAIMFNSASKPTKYAEYQEFRCACKVKVDAEMATLKSNLIEYLNEPMEVDDEY